MEAGEEGEHSDREDHIVAHEGRGGEGHGVEQLSGAVH